MSQKANRKKTVLIGGAFLVIVLVLYFVIVYPWPVVSNLSGTIGGVE